ncbi:MAG: response regulator [Myxococcaceae bacterium]
MARFDAIGALADVVEDERERIVRLWRKRLSVELHEVQLERSDLQAPLHGIIAELGRLLRVRGEEALYLWPEAVRSHGVHRYENRFDSDDLAREFKALQEVLLRVYARRHGGIEPQVAEIIAELIGEATASVEASFARVLRTEEVRFREAAMMETLLHHVEVGIMLIDLDGSVSYATPPVGRIVGLPARTIVGMRPHESMSALLSQLEARHLDGRPFRAEELPYVRVLEGKQPVRGVQMIISQPPAGTETIVEMSATPLRGDNEVELSGVIQTMTDVTASAQRARELTEAYEEMRRLQGRLLQRTRTQALGQLASGTAHALNNQLNVIRLRLTLLRRDCKPENLDALDKTVGNIGDLVARLQEFSVHRTEEQLSDVDPNQTIREALELAGPELSDDSGPIQVDTQLKASGLTRVDPGLLRELIVNLIFAARDRMKGGGKLSLVTGEEHGSIVIKVRDSGPPYTEDELAQLFDPLVPSSKRPQVALMLAVARTTIERWGGELRSDNREGDNQGGKFTVRLPLILAESKPLPREVRAGRTRLVNARRVLVVDDDVDNAQMMAEVLQDEGYEVKVAHSGEAALQQWRQSHFDAALLDALMPDLSGWELAKLIRAETPHALLAMVTGADVRGQNRANLAMVDAVFRKPVDVGALDEFLSQGEHPPTGGAPVMHS